MLDLGPGPAEEEPRERPAGWSLLDLDDDTRAPEVVEVPDKDLFDIEHKPEGAFPIERAVLFSIAAHILILIFLLHAPFSLSSPSHRRGILGAFVDSERQRELDRKIPIIFRSAPGPARENPRRADLSDATRRAGGGDPNRPKSDTPFIAPRPGKEGLRPGDMAARSRSVPPPATGTGAQASAAAAPGEKATGGPDSFKVLAPGKASDGREGVKLADLDKAIREAAKGVGSAAGEQGAGFPNPDGGFVDSGPISFDTTWYDWGPYAEEMVRRIRLHWEIPELARLGWKGKLTVRFFIRGDGRVEGARIISVSGVPPFDNAALQAILTSSPFRPLPKDLGSDREGVTVTFFYNIRPEKDGQRSEK